MLSGQKYPPNGCALPLQTITSPGILSISPLSALFHFEEGQMNPGRVLFWVSVYLGRFHCRELFMSKFYCAWKTLAKAAALRACCRQESKKKALFLHPKLQRLTFDLTTKGNADSLTIIQVLVSHIFPTTWELLQNGLNEQNSTTQLLKSRQKTVRFYKPKCWEPL